MSTTETVPETAPTPLKAEADPHLRDEIEKRRTFAIISHPDAGKTTLTEKLLLKGGAIHEAGEIKARKADRFALSDWMTMEKERGISVTSSVMKFPYRGYELNLLDTPGHRDFSEDTYRVLTAADSFSVCCSTPLALSSTMMTLSAAVRDRKSVV